MGLVAGCVVGGGAGWVGGTVVGSVVGSVVGWEETPGCAVVVVCGAVAVLGGKVLWVVCSEGDCAALVPIAHPARASNVNTAAPAAQYRIFICGPLSTNSCAYLTTLFPACQVPMIIFSHRNPAFPLGNAGL